MSSSISSFRGELKVLVAVACLVGVGEVAVRYLAPILDDDRRHIQQLPHLARGLANAPGPRVLFLGNSLTLHGVDTDVVRGELNKAGFPSATVERVVPVGTDVLDWNYLFRTYFAEPGCVPDVIVVGFVRHHVTDNPPKELERLGCHFVSLQNMPDLFARDLPVFGDRVQVAISHAMGLMGNQLPMQNRILDALIPEYQTGTRWVAHRLEDRAEEQAARANGGRESSPTFDRLHRFAALLKAAGARAIFVPMPLPNVWRIEPDAARAVRDVGMAWVDARKLPGMQPADWYDGYHLGDGGAEIYSRFIARAVARELAGRFPSPARPAP